MPTPAVTEWPGTPRIARVDCSSSSTKAATSPRKPQGPWTVSKSPPTIVNRENESRISNDSGDVNDGVIVDVGNALIPRYADRLQSTRAVVDVSRSPPCRLSTPASGSCRTRGIGDSCGADPVGSARLNGDE